MAAKDKLRGYIVSVPCRILVAVRAKNEAEAHQLAEQQTIEAHEGDLGFSPTHANVVDVHWEEGCAPCITLKVTRDLHPERNAFILSRFMEQERKNK